MPKNKDLFTSNIRGRKKCEGLVYFTQRIQEMLNYETEHIYSFSLMNTALLVSEYEKETKQLDLHSENRKSIIKEFIESFFSDPVIEKNVNKLEKTNIKKELDPDGGNVEKLEKNEEIMVSLLKDLRIDKYIQWCKDYLRINIPGIVEIKSDNDMNQIKKIDTVIQNLVSGLISYGYCQDFIMHYNRKVFGETKFDSAEDALNIFLNRFDLKEHHYKVVIPVKNKNVFSKLEFPVHLDEYAAEINKFRSTKKLAEDLQYESKFCTLLSVELTAPDPYSAVEKAYDALNLLASYLRYFSQSKESKSNDKGNLLLNLCSVWDVNDVSKHESVYPLKVEHSPNHYTFRSLPGNQDIVNLYKKIFGCPEYRVGTFHQVIDNSVKIYNSALTTSDLNSAFLNLWSILEVLFIPHDNKDSGRMKEIQNNVKPILLFNYLSESIIKDLQVYIQTYIPQDKLDTIRQKLSVKDDEENWFIYLFLSDEPDARMARDTVSDLLSKYPLIRVRMRNVNILFSSNMNIRKEMFRYSRRIKYHMQRLYRARNNIIHSGDQPERIKELGEHLQTYITECINTFIEIMIGNPKVSLEDSLNLIHKKEKDIYDMLSRRRKLKNDKEMIDQIFDFFQLTATKT